MLKLRFLISLFFKRYNSIVMCKKIFEYNGFFIRDWLLFCINSFMIYVRQCATVKLLKLREVIEYKKVILCVSNVWPKAYYFGQDGTDCRVHKRAALCTYLHSQF